MLPRFLSKQSPSNLIGAVLHFLYGVGMIVLAAIPVDHWWFFRYTFFVGGAFMILIAYAIYKLAE